MLMEKKIGNEQRFYVASNDRNALLFPTNQTIFDEIIRPAFQSLPIYFIYRQSPKTIWYNESRFLLTVTYTVH